MFTEDDSLNSESSPTFDFDSGQLSYVGKECSKLPSILGKVYGTQTRRLDASFNCLQNLEGIKSFSNLEELVLDNNELGDDIAFDWNANLVLLSLNKNKITKLDCLLSKLKVSFSRLKYLSLLGNDACPDRLSNSEKDDDDYQRYRYRVIYKLPNLIFLDSSKIKYHERLEAMRVGEYTNILRPDLVQILEAQRNVMDDGDIVECAEETAESENTASYGKLMYKYVGKHSEGNRFIRNQHL
ncbi:hypothetical protein HDE_07320 [Halotydeus destructor]|nr:hypothetical protein HDE_07320 [Halotydeus destructor]